MGAVVPVSVEDAMALRAREVFEEDGARYEPVAAELYAAFHGMPNASAVVDNWNAVHAVRQAVEGRSGLRVVDLGCGSGSRTRELAAMPETATALGIDCSHGQLSLAYATPHPVNCRFAFCDLVTLGKGQPEPSVEGMLGTFDVGLMEFVACHAGTPEDFDAMIRAAAGFLGPGGQLIVIDGHPHLDRAPLPTSDRYAISRTLVLPPGHAGVVRSFTEIRTTFFTPRGELSVLDYFHDVQTWAAACDAAGLSGLTIHDVLAPPHPEPGFWDEYVRPDHPCGCAQTAVIRAHKRQA